MATGGGRGRSYAGKARSFPCAPASIAEVSQGREVPRRCNRPPQALARPPPLGACIGRGPARFRAVAEAIRPAAGTYTNMYIIKLLTLKCDQLYKYKAYNPTAWCAGFVPTKAQRRWQRAAIADDPTQERPDLSPAHLPRLQRCRREERYHDAATDHRKL